MAGRFTYSQKAAIPKLLVLCKNGGLLLPELLTFQEKLEIVGHGGGTNSAPGVADRQCGFDSAHLLGQSLSLSLDCRHLGGGAMLSRHGTPAPTKQLAQSI